MDSGVLTVGAGPRHSWRRFPWALLAAVLALAPLVSLLRMVSYRVVSPWWLSLMPRVGVGEVALSVVLSVKPVVRSLRALLWFTVSLMLFTAAGGWCGSVCGLSVACVRGWALAGSCGSVWEGVQWVAWAAGDAVGEGGAAGVVGAAGDCVVDGALWLVWWRGCRC